MLRDSLADSSRTMINHGRRELLRRPKQKKHIGPIDPHALKIPARRAESYSVRFTLIFTLNQYSQTVR
jgi:hypothetical protein